MFLNSVKTMLVDPSVAGIVKNLEARLKADTIYSYIGHVLVVCNPYKWLPIYGNETMKYSLFIKSQQSFLRRSQAFSPIDFEGTTSTSNGLTHPLTFLGLRSVLTEL
jgi:hypothetical protein